MRKSMRLLFAPLAYSVLPRSIRRGLGGKEVATISALLSVAPFMQAHASLMATATFTDTQPTPGTFEYDITLNNTGTTTIGTFWFSWIPGQGFMSVPPTNVLSPANWTANLTNSGESIQWIDTSGLMAPGASVSGFIFDSTLSPGQLEGPGLGNSLPTSSFFVYLAAPLGDPGFGGIAQPAAATPVPAALLLFATGLAALGLLGWRRKRKRPDLHQAI